MTNQNKIANNQIFACGKFKHFDIIGDFARSCTIFDPYKVDIFETEDYMLYYIRKFNKNNDRYKDYQKFVKFGEDMVRIPINYNEFFDEAKSANIYKMLDFEEVKLLTREMDNSLIVISVDKKKTFAEKVAAR